MVHVRRAPVRDTFERDHVLRVVPRSARRETVLPVRRARRRDRLPSRLGGPEGLGGTGLDGTGQDGTEQWMRP